MLPRVGFKVFRRNVWRWGGILSFALMVGPAQLSAATVADEYELKAALIYKLSKFVEWPHTANIGQPGNFDICVLGEDSFSSSLEALNSFSIGGQQIRVSSFAPSEAVNDRCKVLFISSSNPTILSSILESLQGKPTLTLSDTKDFAARGGMIQFTRSNKKIDFRINLASARRSGLTIAAPLLQLAVEINSVEEPAS